MGSKTQPDRTPSAPASRAAINRRPTPRHRAGPWWTPPARAAAEGPRVAGLFLQLWPAYFRFQHGLGGRRRDGRRVAGRNLLLLEPGLKHQHVPQSRRPIPLLGKVLPPPLPYLPGVEKAFLTQTGFAQ